MLVVKVDRFDAETLQTRLARLHHIFRATVGDLAAAAAEIAEFCRQHDAAAPSGNGLADERFVVAVPIGIRGVEQRNAPIQRLMDECDALVVVARAVSARKRHAT